jgi:NADH-quinone oxidoreductase subunit C
MASEQDAPDPQDQQGLAPDMPVTPVTPSNPQAATTVAFVRQRFPAALVEVVEQRGETTLVLRPEALVEVCAALRDARRLRYGFLADITAVDWLERDPRYDVVYHLLSLETHAVARLKVRVGDADHPDPEVPSVTSVWPAADWYEREVYDLFGIRFAGHPNLRRIEMPDDWVSHPLRKDYPLTGIHLPEPHWGGQVPFEAPLSPQVGEQTLRAPNRTGGVSSAPAPIAEET